MNVFLAYALPLTALCAIVMFARRMGGKPAAEPLESGPSFLDDVPEHLTLVPLDASFTAGPEIVGVCDGLARVGFEDAGDYSVEGLPDTCFHMLVHPGHSLYAMVGCHGGETWVEMWCAYPDGRRVTYTTLPGRGFAGRPGTTVVRMAGASPLELFASICWERPMGVFLPVDARLAASDFEKAYALWAAWRHAQDPAREVRERTAA